MNDFLIIYEETATGFSAFVPALPGVAAAGENREETERLIREAIAFHIEGLGEDAGRSAVVFVRSVEGGNATVATPPVSHAALVLAAGQVPWPSGQGPQRPDRHVIDIVAIPA